MSADLQFRRIAVFDDLQVEILAVVRQTDILAVRPPDRAAALVGRRIGTRDLGPVNLRRISAGGRQRRAPVPQHRRRTDERRPLQELTSVHFLSLSALPGFMKHNYR